MKNDINVSQIMCKLDWLAEYDVIENVPTFAMLSFDWTV
jgi:hypothetical protein